MKTHEHLIRAVAAKLIGWGLSVPEKGVGRLQEYARLRHALQHLRINCAIDVGANRGETGRLLRRLGFQGQIHSFEPQPASYAALKDTSHRDANWSCYPLALGSSEGSMTLKVNPVSEEMSSLMPLRDPPGEMVEQGIDVVPLDDLFLELVAGLESPRVLLKVDAEGYDLEVVRGATKSLPLIKLLMVEVFVAPTYLRAPQYLDVLSELESRGYRLDQLTHVSRTERDELMCLNALMVRSDKH